MLSSLALFLSQYLGLIYSIADDKKPDVHMAASLFRQICYANKNAVSAGIIVAGYDEFGGPSVYSIPLGGSIHKQKFALGGSGSQYIYGYCDANFQEDMTKEKAIEFAKNCKFLSQLYNPLLATYSLPSGCACHVPR